MRLAAAAAAALATVSPPVQPRVLVTDREVAPRILHVAVGATVVWQNLGSRPHVIRGAARTWPSPPLSLAAGTTRSVTFRRAGRYPYTVDRRRRAVVVVGATGSAALVWRGTMKSSGTLAVPGNACHDAFLTRVELDVAADGSVYGTGNATATLPARCQRQPKVPPVRSVELVFEGTFSPRSGFTVRAWPVAVTGQLEAGFFANWLSAGGFDPPPQKIPLASATQAGGTVTLTDHGRYHAGTTVNVWRLTRG